MGGDGSMNPGTGPQVSVEQLLRNFLDVQKRRASVYNILHQGFADLLKTNAESPYREVCSQVTTSFSESSKQVLEIEAALRAPCNDRPDLAAVLQAVQAQEKQKLHMTATLQVLKRAGRPSERAHALEQGHHSSNGSHTQSPLCSHGPEGEAEEDSGLEMAQLEAEFDAAIKEATGIVQNAVLEINDHIEAIRYEIEELEEKRESTMDEGER
ncbi:unnamed protein product [Calypogeia fissa]